MTATLSDDDRTLIDRDTRCRSIETTAPPTSSAQLDQALALAIALYETAAAHGVDKATADGVTSFVDAAVEGIRARDRRPRGCPVPPELLARPSRRQSTAARASAAHQGDQATMTDTTHPPTKDHPVMSARRIVITFKVDDDCTLTDAEIEEIGGHIAALVERNRDAVVLPLRSDDINVHWHGDKMVSGPSALTEPDAG